MCTVLVAQVWCVNSFPSAKMPGGGMNAPVESALVTSLLLICHWESHCTREADLQRAEQDKQEPLETFSAALITHSFCSFGFNLQSTEESLSQVLVIYLDTNICQLKDPPGDEQQRESCLWQSDQNLNFSCVLPTKAWVVHILVEWTSSFIVLVQDCN